MHSPSGILSTNTFLTLVRQVAPAELEGVLLGHSDVRDVGVTGVPDPEAGEVPRAFVVRKPGSTVTEVELESFLEGRYAVHPTNYARAVVGIS